MIIQFLKTLNDKNEYTLISFTMEDSLNGINKEKFDEANCNIYETVENYYYYIKDIIDISNCEKFKIKVKKGDIVSLTARDNSYIIFPSKKSFSYAFNLDYNKVLIYVYKEVLRDGKPFEVKYIKDNEMKIVDGVVYTLSQLASYVSQLIKGYNYRKIAEKSKEDEIINRVINKFYDKYRIEIDRKYEINVKKCGLNENNQPFSFTIVNISKSNHYLYDYYLIRMFAYMIWTKSLRDDETKNLPEYCFDRKFSSLEEVYKFLEENQDIVNNFFIETNMLFNKPNDMITAFAPHINGIYMFYEYNNVKTYLYRTKEQNYFNEKSLKATYVSKHYKHKIKGIKNNYSI